MGGTLTIAGLGPGRCDLRTIGAQRAIDDATTIILRTLVHPGLEDLKNDPRVTTCDDLYHDSRSFEDLYTAIADRVVDAMNDGPVLFAVPGHPLVGEKSAHQLIRWATAQDVRVIVIDGVSAVDAVASALVVDPIAEQAQILDAAAISALSHEAWPRSSDWGIDPRRACLVTQVYDRHIAASTKLLLERWYPDDHPVAVVRGAGGGPSVEVAARALFELDRIDVDHLTSVWIYPQEPLAADRSPLTLQSIVNRLRSPDGCPWDRAQTPESLRDDLIEEAYEVVDAIDEGDPHHLAEELGDLALQAFLQAQIADERGDFALEDVWAQINQKLVRRHPHVFDELEAVTVEQVRATWDEVKASEPGRMLPEESDRGRLKRLPRSMPAMTRAMKLLGTPHAAPGPPSEIDRHRIGDSLLALLRNAAMYQVDAEAALSQALDRACTNGTLQPASNK